MITIPNRQSKIVKQTNRSKLLSDLYASFNLDLQSNLGVIKVSPRLQLNTGSVSNQGRAVAFKDYFLKIFAICGTRVFKSGSHNLISAFTEDVSTGAITSYDPNTADMETFNNVLCATADTKLMSFDGGTWTQRGGNLTTGSLHKLCYFAKFNRLYYFDNTETLIKSISSAWAEATSSTYTYLSDYKNQSFYTMCSDGSQIWVGTMVNGAAFNNYTDSCFIFSWDGSTANSFSSRYMIKSKGILALCKDDRNIMHAITCEGQLLAFTGSGFEEIGRLPLNRELLLNSNTGLYNSFIHPNGFYFTRNGTFIALINNNIGDNGNTVKDNIASGIWEFHRDTGFVHRQSLSYTPMASSTITDFGQNRLSSVGALAEVNIYSSSSTGKPTLICGATYFTNASSTTDGIFIDEPLDTVQKYGYFITSWFMSGNLKDAWQKLALKYRQLLSETDKIVTKYRTRELASTEISITWVDTLTFTTTTDISTKTGYEVEVLQGTGSGKCAHIVSVTNNAGTYTVVVDDTFTGVTTGTAKARVENWKKALVISDQTTEADMRNIDTPASMRIQVKVCMQFTGEDEVYELAIINAPHTLLS